MDPRLPIIAKVAKALNEKNVRWAVGGSSLLYLKGISNSFNDLDLVVMLEDAELAKEALMGIGQYIPSREAKSSAKVFDEFIVDGLDIDLISGMVFETFGQKYDLSFKNDNTEEITIEGERVVLDSLDTWYEIYNLQGRVEKARFIKDYLLYNKK